MFTYKEVTIKFDKKNEFEINIHHLKSYIIGKSGHNLGIIAVTLQTNNLLIGSTIDASKDHLPVSVLLTYNILSKIKRNMFIMPLLCYKLRTHVL